ncbi:hypothetical protein [Bacillus sp. JCM 19034]|uniref:hypothetical protein n=1 Tax=Bacillus sp. JCM 19034 TaxID=1481928 RepID=UPI000785C819|nr:hypothetical protein [Bacillus sp. JCM 19034]
MSQQIEINGTTDMELVQLSGLHAYLEYDRGSYFKIDSKEFEVIDTEYNHLTGLDALTVQNLATGEYTVVFVGTDVESKYGMQDVKTNIQLVTSQRLLSLRRGLNMWRLVLLMLQVSRFLINKI